MNRKRLLTLALSASFGLICGCRSCMELSFQRVGIRGGPACSAPEVEGCAAPPCAGGVCGMDGLDDGPALLPPAGCGVGTFPPAPPPPVGLAPQPRLVPQPQAAVQPYQPASSQPRLLSALDR